MSDNRIWCKDCIAFHVKDDHNRPEPHVHEKLDMYGYCVSCNFRVMSSFKGFPLPDRPKEPHGQVRHMGSE